MEVVSFPEALVPGPLRVQVDALQDLEWPPDLATGRHGHDPALTPFSVLLTDADQVVACLDILSKPLRHAGLQYTASGLSAVVTAARFRGRGHGRRLVRAAGAMIQAAGTDLGILTCDPGLAAFYEGAGWQQLPGTSLIGGTPQDPLPSDQLNKVAMATFHSDLAREHAHTFQRSRIELYPGDIDRLW